MKQVSAEIIYISEISPSVYLIRVRAPEIAALARPGQYVMVHCGEGHVLPLRRPLSIHRVFPDDGIAFLFSVVGRGTEWLARCGEGFPLNLFGPLGRGFEIHESSRNLLLVAGGIGIAPLVALAEQATAAGCSVTLLMGVEEASQAYPDSLLPSGIETYITTEDGSLGTKGMVTDLLHRFIPVVDQIFTCGPLPMYLQMVEMSSQLVDKPTQALLEVVLGCGVGACLGCTVETRNGPRSVCQDGPVFELGEIIWDKMVPPTAGVSRLAGIRGRV